MTDNLLGAFARIFARPDAAALAEAFEEHNLGQVQLNLAALGIPTIPTGAELERLDLGAIARAFLEHNSMVWGVSATYNTAHPDSGIRAATTRDAAAFIAQLAPSGAVAATLSSGSRDSASMWAHHPDTTSEAAWHDFRESLDVLLEAAESADVLLAIEPEPANTVADAARAVRLLEELGADGSRIGFILDPANLISAVAPARHRSTLEHAFAVLGERTICVHAKDTVPWSRTLDGAGVVDYDLVGALYNSLPHPVPLIIQDTTEAELGPVAAMLRRRVFATTP